jgi:hypothetical protein
MRRREFITLVGGAAVTRPLAEAEHALKISGPVNDPWGRKRPRYPYRPHELNAAALVMAEGAKALGIAWSPTPLATVSAPRCLSVTSIASKSRLGRSSALARGH